MNDKLQNDIEVLRSELSKIESSDAVAEHILALNAAIDQLQEDANLDQRREASKQLNEAVTNFEIDHPIIHGLLRNLMKSLGDIGI